MLDDIELRCLLIEEGYNFSTGMEISNSELYRRLLNGFKTYEKYPLVVSEAFCTYKNDANDIRAMNGMLGIEISAGGVLIFDPLKHYLFGINDDDSIDPFISLEYSKLNIKRDGNRIVLEGDDYLDDKRKRIHLVLNEKENNHLMDRMNDPYQNNIDDSLEEHNSLFWKEIGDYMGLDISMHSNGSIDSNSISMLCFESDKFRDDIKTVKVFSTYYSGILDFHSVDCLLDKYLDKNGVVEELGGIAYDSVLFGRKDNNEISSLLGRKSSTSEQIVDEYDCNFVRVEFPKKSVESIVKYIDTMMK